MAKYKLPFHDAEKKIIRFLFETEGDTLAAIFQYVFSAEVESCFAEDDHLVVEFESEFENESANGLEKLSE